MRPISGDWGELGIPNFVRMSLVKCYWMLQNIGVIGFIASELLREEPTGSKTFATLEIQNLCIVTFLEYSESWHISNPTDIQNPLKDLRWSVLQK